MAWTISISDFAAKQFKKLNKSIAKELLDFMKNKVAPLDDPTLFGKPLINDKAGLWRYRVRDYRIICKIDNNELTILVVRIGHRKEVYE